MLDTANKKWTPLTRTEMAARVAQDIPAGWYVNLGIGIPTLIANYLPLEREVVCHSENGILGMGPVPPPDQVNRWLVSAGKQHITLRPGGSYFHHADSFAIVRGGHLDLCVLGSFQVAENGDIANWTTSADATPAVGGAMDLCVGAKNLWVVMNQTTREGESKLVRKCSYPVTALGCVRRVYTDIAVFHITPDGFQVVDMVDGLTFEELADMTDAPLLRQAA